MKTPLFSIVIPTYNRADLLKSAIRSILLQTLEDFEIVVSDNHSTDDTAQVVAAIPDPRIRYLKPPHHMRHVDHFEFIRLQARGEFVLVLGDDDALVRTALEQFADAAKRLDGDFLFCKVAEYRTNSFPGPDPNTVDCPPFSCGARAVGKDEYLQGVFAFNLKFTFHPTAYIFSRALAEKVAERGGGRFFRTNGIEAYAWPMCAAFAKKIIYIDAPLAILGRTSKSFGTNVVLCNTGNQRQQVATDYGIVFDFAPLHTMSFPNLMCDGILGAKRTAPEAFEKYEFNERAYLRATMRGLQRLRAQNVDVSADVAELLAYAEKYPGLGAELNADRPAAGVSLTQRIRTTLGDLGARKANGRLTAIRQVRKLRRGEWNSPWTLSGAMLGFHDIVGCAEFLTPYVSRTTYTG